jgi:hypothetical protein
MPQRNLRAKRKQIANENTMHCMFSHPTSDVTFFKKGEWKNTKYKSEVRNSFTSESRRKEDL